MLSTGLRTPIGLKTSGADLAAIEQIGAQVRGLLPRVSRSTRSVFAERMGSGSFLDFEWTARSSCHWIEHGEVRDVVAKAIGGENDHDGPGTERYPVNVRHRAAHFPAGCRRPGPRAHHDPRRRRSASDTARRTLATISTATGPSMIRNEGTAS